MKKIITYEAEDGTIFKDEKSAREYEERMLKGHWYDVEFAVNGSVVMEICAYSKEEAIKIAKETFDPYDKDCMPDWELGEVLGVYE